MTTKKGSERRDSGKPAPQVSPYEHTKTGLIGNQRDTMLQSELQSLVRIPRRSVGYPKIERARIIHFRPNWDELVDGDINCHRRVSPMGLPCHGAMVVFPRVRSELVGMT